MITTSFARERPKPYAARVANTPTPIHRAAKPSDDIIRDVIIKVAEQRKMTRYDLAKMMEEHGIAPMVTYQFLRKPDAQLRSKTASAFLKALGIELKIGEKSSD